MGDIKTFTPRPLDVLSRWLTEAGDDGDDPRSEDEFYLRSSFMSLYEEVDGLHEKFLVRGLPIEECRENIFELCQQLERLNGTLGRVGRQMIIDAEAARRARSTQERG